MQLQLQRHAANSREPRRERQGRPWRYSLSACFLVRSKGRVIDQGVNRARVEWHGAAFVLRAQMPEGVIFCLVFCSSLVLPLTGTNAKLVQILVLLSAGTLRASPALYTPHGQIEQ